MFRKFLTGLVFGAGFAIAFTLVCTFWITWALPKYLENKVTSTKPPSLTASENKFLGTPGSSDGNFDHTTTKELSPGLGQIVGKITADGIGVAGQRIRLELNGNVRSHWAKTNSDGTYNIKVPVGEYRIDGYQLHSDDANRVLEGKIDDQANPYGGVSFKVVEGKPGEGLNLNYVSPIIKLAPKGEFRLTDSIVARWEPYPNAQLYRIQIQESANLHDTSRSVSMFSISKMPQTSENEINISQLGISLKPGKHYKVEITAFDQSGRVLSETVRYSRDKDFKVVE